MMEARYLIIKGLRQFGFFKFFPKKTMDFSSGNVENENIETLNFSEDRIYIFKQARVWGCDGVVLDKKGTYFNQFNRQSLFQKRNPIFYQFKFKLPEKIIGNVAMLAMPSSNVYYHWIIDVLPRLLSLKENIGFSKIDHFLFGKITHKFQYEIIELLGIPKSKIITMDNLWDFHYQVENLIFPEFASNLNETSKRSISLIKNFFKINENEISNTSKIYLSRRKAQNRKILQETELLEILKEKGIEIFYPEDYSIEDQIKKFYSSDVIIGPHGGGFTNIVFCQPDTTIIDVCAPEWINDCFKSISENNNLNYIRIIGAKFKKYETQEVKGADISLDINEFRIELDKILS